MLLQNIRAKIGARLSGKSEEGFTLIELLVVMLILGILAAIALPAFFNQKGKANDSKAKESAHAAEVAMETCATENASGAYNSKTSPCNTTTLKQIEPTLPSATKVEGKESFAIPTVATKSYKITVTSTTGNEFSIERKTTGEFEYKCKAKEAANRGGCPASELWTE